MTTTPTNSLSSGGSSELVREITDLLPAYVAYVDTDLRYVTANRMYVERFGRGRHQIVGQLVAEVTGKAFDNIAGHLRAALAGETQQFEPQMISVDGDRVLSVTHLPHRNSQGTVIGVIVYGYDITELRRAEAALRQSEKLAAVGRLASSIAHEINNPLESVINLLYLVEQNALEDPEQTRAYARLAQQELARVTQITTSTLRFFRQSTGRISADVAAITESVLALYAPRMLSANVQVQRRIEAGVTLCCYDGEVRQVLNNLVTNAVDAMRHGGTLHVRVRRSDNGVRITVADTGYGMSPDTQARVFEPFFTTKGVLGTGLGLWIAQELIARHNGRLRVRSRTDHGTVFVLSLRDWVAGPRGSNAEVDRIQ